ncbi:SsgA family sporulation/cell division regulator [Streptomyces chartreusis]|uniref:SsgA family sporulation/cell division regulator n=1 Tax=Streptomyces chartreusis TaxID=1969 RepID=UPI003864AEC1|nr:SsgA family sporulation/cell division regulator [Streptomyces chartreusis]WSZ73460.1 SsgA family sporulation/cell division regulator [Streptomyces chartreusis]
MTVRKDEPMDHLAATDEEFDALLDASSLGAPHVVAETGDIPAAARHRMTQALHRQRRSLGNPDSTDDPQRDEADHQPGEPAGEERAVRKIHMAGRVHFLLAIGTGNAFLALLERRLLSGTSSARRYQPLARQSWPVPSTPVLLRSARCFFDGLEEGTKEGRPRHCVPRGDAALVLLPARNATQPAREFAATARCRTNPEAPDGAFAVDAYRHAMQMLWPDRTAATPRALHTSSWPWARERLRSLRHLIEPSVQPERPLFSITPTGLLTWPAAPARLHLARFTSYAYTTVGGGLLVPRRDDASQGRRAEAGAARCELKEPTRAGGMKLRRRMVDGGLQLSAEVPMLFHFDEHESLALTSDLQTRLTYRALDPYAVEARFRTDDQRETVWIFARDLLKNGLERRDGLGDVAVWPGNGMLGEPRVFLRISSPEGSALLSAADTDVRAFLEAISGLVAYGTEHLHLAPALNALEATIGELARPGRRD